MTDELAVQRAEEAKQLLANPLFAEAFAAIREEVINQWTNSKSNEDVGREKLWITLKLLDRLQSQITQVVQTGKVAQASLLQKAKAAALKVGERLYNS
mgnify:CR=1 FL=1